jgi:hypothetical protein
MALRKLPGVELVPVGRATGDNVRKKTGENFKIPGKL